MRDFYVKVDPVIIYPQCLEKGRPQDCFNCVFRNSGQCHSPRSMCVLPYKNHKNGCPNYGKRDDCPPFVPMFDEVFDISKPIYAILSTFDLLSHTEKMKKKHPEWNEAQCLNVLYWQGTVKKKLKENIKTFNYTFRQLGYYSTTTPEAMGVDVTQTLKNSGIILEWPARKTVYKVALAGIPLNDKYNSILK